MVRINCGIVRAFRTDCVLVMRWQKINERDFFLFANWIPMMKHFVINRLYFVQKIILLIINQFFFLQGLRELLNPPQQYVCLSFSFIFIVLFYWLLCVRFVRIYLRFSFFFFLGVCSIWLCGHHCSAVYVFIWFLNTHEW